MDNDWKHGLDLVRMRNKAILARLFYNRTDAKIQNLRKTTEEKFEIALQSATRSEERSFREATSENDYRTSVYRYIQTSACKPDTIQAAVDLAPLNGDLHRFQLCSDLLEGSSQDAIMFRVWILLESFSRMDYLTKPQIWPLVELPLAMMGAHPITINAARQHLQLPPLAHTLFIYVNVLIQYVGGILYPQHPQPPPLLALQPHHPQYQQGPYRFQEEFHALIMAFLKQT